MPCYPRQPKTIESIRHRTEDNEHVLQEFGSSVQSDHFASEDWFRLRLNEVDETLSAAVIYEGKGKHLQLPRKVLATS